MTVEFHNKTPIFNDPRTIKKIHSIYLLGVARIIYFSLLSFIKKFFEYFSQVP